MGDEKSTTRGLTQLQHRCLNCHAVRCSNCNRKCTTVGESNPDNKLCLDQFLKLAGVVSTGGQAKMLIQGGEVQVNGEVETRRRRKLSPGDMVEVDGQAFSPDEFFA